ncbi:MAG: LLM class oxidoreductase [Bacteroidota bacterium]
MANPSDSFADINRGYNSLFQPNKLSIGLVIPTEHYAQGPIPTMVDHLKRVQLAEQLGFKAVWVRDIPHHVPGFGDAGQTYDPFTYLGYLAGQTSEITLATGSIALPLHHPVHVAKSAATIDQLSQGRLVIGVASGDRPDEYPALGVDFDQRGDLFRQSFEYIRKAAGSFPTLETEAYGTLTGQTDVLPKPTGPRLPMLITGYSQQSLEWNAEHGDGWMYYPRDMQTQRFTIQRWRDLIAEHHGHSKPFMHPLYVVLERDDVKPQPIQLGMRVGVPYLTEYFQHLQEIGVNHVGINLRFNHQPMEATLERIATEVLPHFHSSSLIPS